MIVRAIYRQLIITKATGEGNGERNKKNPTGNEPIAQNKKNFLWFWASILVRTGFSFFVCLFDCGLCLSRPVLKIQWQIRRLFYLQPVGHGRLVTLSRTGWKHEGRGKQNTQKREWCHNIKTWRCMIFFLPFPSPRRLATRKLSALFFPLLFNVQRVWQNDLSSLSTVSVKLPTSFSIESINNPFFFCFVFFFLLVQFRRMPPPLISSNGLRQSLTQHQIVRTKLRNTFWIDVST